MSRFSDGDWEEAFNNQGLLWWHNVEQAIAGRKGRKVLEELRAVLLAMPEKRLINGKLCDGKDVCAVGALVVERQAKAEGKDRAEVIAAYAPDENLNCLCSDERAHHPGDGACLVCQGHLDQWVLEHPDRPEDAKYSIYACKGYRPDLEYEDAWDTVAVAEQVGLPRLASYAIEYHNDEEEDSDITPEQRYENTLRWIDEKLAKPLLTRKRRVS